MWHKGWWNDHPHVLSQSTVPYSNTVLFLINASQRLQKCQASPVRLSLFPWKVTQNSCLPAKKNEYSTQSTKGCLNLSSTSNIVRQPCITSSINALFWEYLNTIWQKPNCFFVLFCFFFVFLPLRRQRNKQYFSIWSHETHWESIWDY